jgi:hypothetical protein
MYKGIHIQWNEYMRVNIYKGMHIQLNTYARESMYKGIHVQGIHVQRNTCAYTGPLAIRDDIFT